MIFILFKNNACNVQINIIFYTFMIYLFIFFVTTNIKCRFWLVSQLILIIYILLYWVSTVDDLLLDIHNICTLYISFYIDIDGFKKKYYMSYLYEAININYKNTFTKLIWLSYFITFSIIIFFIRDGIESTKFYIKRKKEKHLHDFYW